MSVLIDLAGVKPRITSLSPVVDGGGNVFIAMCEYNDADAYNGRVRVIKVDRLGAVHEVGVREPEGGKGDSCFIVQSGTNLLVGLSVHISDPRTQLQMLPPFLGVCVPYATGGPQLGAPGAYLEEATEMNGATADEIAAAVAARLASQFDRTVANIKPKVMAAIEEEGVLRESTVYTSAALFERLDETIYGTVFKVLRESGLIH
jgi:hypothetical protein